MELRGLGGPSTISQLKESETKKNSFVTTVCRKLKFQTRWISVEPIGLSEDPFLCWSEDTIVHQVIRNTFALEMEFETLDSNGKIWGIPLYLSPTMQERERQFQYLLDNKFL